jgi:hypothetical protein
MIVIAAPLSKKAGTAIERYELGDDILVFVGDFDDAAANRVVPVGVCRHVGQVAGPRLLDSIHGVYGLEFDGRIMPHVFGV